MRGNARSHRFTVYDVMEAQGVFDDNPANASSPDYQGPQAYPKLFYHPEGKERVIQRAEIIATPLGPQKVGEMFELITRIANDPTEEADLRAKGWHDHPSAAIAASGKEAPPTVTITRVPELEAEIKRLQEQLAEAQKGVVAKPPSDDDAPPPMRSTQNRAA
jgi:hypothetical protein